MEFTRVTYLIKNNDMGQVCLILDQYIMSKGVYLWNNGTAYFGEWNSDQINGKGIYFIPPKTIIQGNFTKNKPNGLVSVKTRQYLFSGQWNNGYPDGEIAATQLLNGQELFCLFNEGKLELMAPNQQSSKKKTNDENIPQIQDIVDNKKQNKQISFIQYHDGGSFLGNISKDQLPSGLGILQYPDGLFDIGQYYNGLLEGFGRIQLSGGDIFQGQFKAGKYHGEGIMIYKNQDDIEYVKGQWKNGALEEMLEQKLVESVNPQNLIIKFKFNQNCLQYDTTSRQPVHLSMLKKLEDIFTEQFKLPHNISPTLSPQNIHLNHYNYSPEKSLWSQQQKSTFEFIDKNSRLSLSKECIQKYEVKQNASQKSEQTLFANIMNRKEQLFPQNQQKDLQEKQVKQEKQEKTKNLQNFYQRLLDQNLHHQRQSSAQSKKHPPQMKSQQYQQGDKRNRYNSENKTNKSMVNKSQNKVMQDTIYQTIRPKSQFQKTPQKKENKNQEKEQNETILSQFINNLSKKPISIINKEQQQQQDSQQKKTSIFKQPSFTYSAKKEASEQIVVSPERKSIDEQQSIKTQSEEAKQRNTTNQKKDDSQLHTQSVQLKQTNFSIQLKPQNLINSKPIEQQQYPLQMAQNSGIMKQKDGQLQNSIQFKQNSSGQQDQSSFNYEKQYSKTDSQTKNSKKQLNALISQQYAEDIQHQPQQPQQPQQPFLMQKQISQKSKNSLEYSQQQQQSHQSQISQSYSDNRQQFQGGIQQKPIQEDELPQQTSVKNNEAQLQTKRRKSQQDQRNDQEQQNAQQSFQQSNLDNLYQEDDFQQLNDSFSQYPKYSQQQNSHIQTDNVQTRKYKQEQLQDIKEQLKNQYEMIIDLKKSLEASKKDQSEMVKEKLYQQILNNVNTEKKQMDRNNLQTIKKQKCDVDQSRRITVSYDMHRSHSPISQIHLRTSVSRAIPPPILSTRSVFKRPISVSPIKRKIVIHRRVFKPMMPVIWSSPQMMMPLKLC